MAKVNLENLISSLRFNYDGSETIIKGFKCCWDAETGYFSFMKYPEETPLKKSVMVIEDWERYYKFDAAENYEDPNIFVAECIAEECMNKYELENAFEEVINELVNKHSKK